jgi:Flp pilus assembly protein TadG
MRSRHQPRRGATVVEAALVLTVCLMLLFGILEYCRYLYALHVVDNAAREGARYAVANTNTATTQNVLDTVHSKLGGHDGTLANFNISLTAVVLQNHDGLTPGTPLSDWTQAGPNDGITVQITGSFVPAVPTLLFFGNTLPVQATSTMFSEGN